MFQASLLKNFSKSFNAPDESKIITLVTNDKIEIKEAIEKLETEVEASVSEIDRLVYGLYGLSGGEVGIVERLK